MCEGHGQSLKTAGLTINAADTAAAGARGDPTHSLDSTVTHLLVTCAPSPEGTTFQNTT